MTDYFGVIVHNLELSLVIAYNSELVSLVICDKIRNLMQSIASSRGHVRQKMRQKWVAQLLKTYKFYAWSAPENISTNSISSCISKGNVSFQAHFDALITF